MSELTEDPFSTTARSFESPLWRLDENDEPLTVVAL
jgi:hypothetical protein